MNTSTNIMNSYAYMLYAPVKSIDDIDFETLTSSMLVFAGYDGIFKSDHNFFSRNQIYLIFADITTDFVAFAVTKVVTIVAQDQTSTKFNLIAAEYSKGRSSEDTISALRQDVETKLHKIVR